MGSVFTNKAPVPGSALAMKQLGCPKSAENPWPAFHQALELTLGQLLPFSNLLQEMLAAQNTGEETALCKFDPVISFPCNKGSPLDKHLWVRLGTNRLDFSAILVLQNGCIPTLMPFLQWLPWDLIQASLVTSKGPLIICGFNNLFFQIASIKSFFLVPQSLSNKRPKNDNCFWFHNSTVSILTSMHFHMHTCQFNSIECLKNELQCYDSPDPVFEALKQSENKKPQTLSKCQICIPTRTGELWGGDVHLVPCTSAGTHQAVCECKILPVQLSMHPTYWADLWEGSLVKPKGIQACSECSFCLTKLYPSTQPDWWWAFTKASASLAYQLLMEKCFRGQDRIAGRGTASV